jgi:serine/threonine protein kinase/DNA-binding NarL/FixJ family response regulator
MAELYLAVATGPGGFRKFVALKQILPEVKDDHRFVAMFLNEARITASLSHPGIAQVFDLVEDRGDFYIAMEFIEGQNLDDVRRACAARNERVPLGYSCRALHDACLALHHAHHAIDPTGQPRPVVHRDITPANIMVTYEGNVKLVDFGLAKDVGASHRDGQQRTVRGTLGFMSPEQLRGEPAQPRSDLYAAGVVLYEMLTGTRFLPADTDKERVDRILGAEVPPPHQFNPAVPPKLSEVTLTALSRDPNLRFASGKDMAAAIDDAAGGLFDVDQMADLVQSLFRRRMDATRTLLAKAETGEHTARLRTGAMALSGLPELLLTSGDVVADGHTPVERFSGHEKILIVDDEEAICRLVKGCLENQGYQVLTCEDSEQAVALVKQEAPDLIILDVMMPRLNGFDLCRGIREALPGRHIPIVFLSGVCSLDERVRALEVGGDDFIEKPFSPLELTARVRTHIHRVRAIHQSALEQLKEAKAASAGIGPLLRKLGQWLSPRNQ